MPNCANAALFRNRFPLHTGRIPLESKRGVNLRPDLIALQRAAVTAAEQNLTRARERMRQTALRHRISSDGLFGQCEYVSRATADARERRARREGAQKERQNLLRALTLLGTAKSSAGAPFAHLTDAVRTGSLTAEAGSAVHQIISAGRAPARRKKRMASSKQD